MSDIPIGDPGKPMEQPNNNLSEAIKQPSVTTSKISSSSKNLSDMPIHVAGLIIERSEYKEQLKLRKVSKSLRALVDSQKPACESIQVECYTNNVNIIFGDEDVMYTKQLYDYEVNNDYGIVVLRDDFKKAAFDDLACTLKNPKLRLEEFRIFEGVFEKKEEYYNEIQCVLESLNHQLSVKEVDLHVLSPSNLLSILPYLKPGSLEKISLSFDHRAVDWRNDSIGMDRIALLEQWKQAEELELRASFDEFPMEYATHFKRFGINERHLDEKKFIRIKNYLSKLENFEHCTLLNMGLYFKPNLVYQLLGASVSSNATEEVFDYSIPDSDYYLEFKKAPGSVELEIAKKKR